MKPGCSISYNQTKQAIIAQYPCFKGYFETVESMIEADPQASSEETIFYDGKPRHVRKRYIKEPFPKPRGSDNKILDHPQGSLAEDSAK
jgi:hypothetical protein